MGTVNIHIKKLTEVLNNYFRSINNTEGLKISRYFLRKFTNYCYFLRSFAKEVGKVEGYKKSLQKRLDKANDEIMNSAYLLEKELVLPVMKKRVRSLFREATKEYIFKSKIIKHGYKKPRGYPGDYQIFEMIYDGKPLSQGLGYYFDKCALHYFLSVGVKNRKNKMMSLLKKYITESESTFFHIMNLGCGSCREIRELIQNNRFNKNLYFTCVDQDEEALHFAKNSINYLPKNISVIFIKKNVIDTIFLKNRKIWREKKQDIIYSLGLADYFLDNTLEIFIKYYYSLLKPGGKLIIAFCSSYNPLIYTPLRWFCEWNFYPRKISFVKDILSSIIDKGRIEITQERTKQVFFSKITKNS